jgi:hypothetical protein
MARAFSDAGTTWFMQPFLRIDLRKSCASVEILYVMDEIVLSVSTFANVFRLYATGGAHLGSRESARLFAQMN